MFIPGFLISIATFPGVIVHEFAHVVFCKFTDTRVLKVCYFRVGNPAGYVIHEQPSTVWRHILIGIGPFFVNTLLGFMLGIIALPMHINFDPLTAAQLILLWLGVSIAMHSFPSTGDAKSIWQAVWSKAAPMSARLIGTPLVLVIFIGATGSIIWLDAVYGFGVVSAAAALQKASTRSEAAPTLATNTPLLAPALTKSPRKSFSQQLEDEGWQYPIKLGDPMSKVHSLLGLPPSTTGFLEDYPRAGLSIWFSPEGRVAKLNFSWTRRRPLCTFERLESERQKYILGLSSHANEEEFKALLGEPDKTTLERSSAVRERRHAWRRNGYLIEGWFLATERPSDETRFPIGALIWFEISPTL